MVEDFIRAGHLALGQWPDTDLFLIPATGFDSMRRDLKGTPALKVAEDLGTPVWLVQDDGNIDTQLSLHLVSRRKTFDSELKKTMNMQNAESKSLKMIRTSQRFESLDATHAICLETWQYKDGRGAVNRWTRLARRESGWQIESVEETTL